MVGKKIAELCLSNNIDKVCFDRGGNIYHGRVQVCSADARFRPSVRAALGATGGTDASAARGLCALCYTFSFIRASSTVLASPLFVQAILVERSQKGDAR